MNKIILIGRTVRTPETSHTESGHQVTKFTLAVNRKFKRDETDFINCVAWNKTAEIVEKYVGRGQQIAIEGNLQTRNYDHPKHGHKVYVSEVIVESVKMLEWKNEDEENEDHHEEIINEDDLPF